MTQLLWFMSRTLSSILVTIACVFSLSGCIIPKGYIDPTFRTATYKDVQSSAHPVPVKVNISFAADGTPVPRAKDIADRKVSRLLESTKVFAKDPAAAASLEIRIQNLGDAGEAFAKGFATGFTFGLVGSHVVDRYEMTVVYRPSAGAAFEGKYNHALHSTVGLKSAPEGMQPVPYADAFDQIVEDMMLRFLVDFQKWQADQQKTANPSAESISAHDAPAGSPTASPIGSGGA
ncbi:MAG: hypothetical protein PHE83_00695 [Opitutaceae bacterium]|nr:hypothetical protein [Opitutaceae bacterium]